MNTALRNRYVSDGAAAMSNERILVALYERLVADLDHATVAIGARQVAIAHDKLVHAQRILEELLLALDADAWDVAANLAGLYMHARELLVTANLRKDAAPVAECKALIVPLAEAWKAAYTQLTTAAAPPAPAAGFGGPATMPAAASAAGSTRSWGA
jgi:flagellar secretion chaperone FliS